MFIQKFRFLIEISVSNNLKCWAKIATHAKKEVLQRVTVERRKVFETCLSKSSIQVGVHYLRYSIELVSAVSSMKEFSGFQINYATKKSQE
jgi:hypothetical protein